jgi:hypothetical protein
MPTEQQLTQALRELAADDPERRGAEIGLASDVFSGVRTRRRRRTVAAAAGVVAATSVLSYAGVQALDMRVSLSPTAQAPEAPTSTSSAGADGSTTLPGSVLQLRGEAVGIELGLPRVTDPRDCAGRLAPYAPGQAFCVDLGNAPDDWLVTELIIDSGRTSAPLRSVGVPWTSDLPAPPPVVIDLVKARLATLAAEFGRRSPQYNRAHVNLEFARMLWVDRAQWAAAGWNEGYWGDPWWPTDAG